MNGTIENWSINTYKIMVPTSTTVDHNNIDNNLRTKLKIESLFGFVYYYMYIKTQTDV